jgi:hypothetical protein
VSGAQVSLTGQVTVALPPGEALALFTPRGEERWVPGWRPRFPVSSDDDTAPGTVFETHADGEHTIWVVAEREVGRRVAYARVTPGSRAGKVTVAADGDGRGGAAVQVTYELTALSPEGARELSDFAACYASFLRSWEEDIATLLRRGQPRWSTT